MYTAIALTRYGSLEIKRAYRKNMTIGIVGAAIILITGVVAYHCFADQSIIEPITLPPFPIDTVKISDIPIRRYEVPRPAQPSLTEKSIPTSGIPNAVPDNEANDNSTIPTEKELWEMVDSKIPTSLDSLETMAIVIANPEEILPSRDTFIKFDEAPQAIESVAPIYPEMARVAGVQGDVWIQAYIDKNGNVKAVEILKASGANAGFEESAIAAARQTTWTPAISNGQPVGVWVSYKIEFRLK